MDAKIKKYSTINLIGTILLCIFKIFQNSFSNGDNYITRRLILLIGLFFTVPTLIISLITFFLVWRFYVVKKFRYNLNYISLTIPFLFILIGLIYFLFNI